MDAPTKASHALAEYPGRSASDTTVDPPRISRAAPAMRCGEFWRGVVPTVQGPITADQRGGMHLCPVSVLIR